MSDAPQDSRWWQASDGKWYPPKDAAPAPGWWLASDGNWYPPVEATADTEATEATAGTEAARDREPAKPNAPASPGRRTRTTRSKTPPPKAPPARKPKAAAAAATSTPKPAPTKSAPKRPARAKSSAAARSGTSPKPSPPAAKAPDSPASPAAKSLPAPRPNPNEGVSPEDQIIRRNRASQADAAVLARSRSVAASRLLTAVAKEVNSTRPDPTTGPAPSDQKATGAAGETAQPTTTRSKQPSAEGRPDTPVATDPLLELKQSALAADIDHIGERLAIFNDRVELRDRTNAVRQSVKGSDITDIVVQKRLTGAILTIETVEGPVMVAKGLRPEQAEEARSLIMRKTRPAGPVQRGDRPAQRADRQAQRSAGPAQHGNRPPPPKPTPAASASVRPAPLPQQRPIDEADVLRKLGDLHRLGILTSEEYESKIELVGSLVRGEITLPA